MRGLQDTLVKLTCTIRKNKRLFELSCWSKKLMIKNIGFLVLIIARVVFMIQLVDAFCT